MSTKLTYAIAAISGTGGRSKMIICASACFTHSFHFLGFGDVTWMTCLARAANDAHGFTTCSLLSVRAQHT